MTSPRNDVNAGTNRWAIAGAIAALIPGAIISRVIGPGVRVEKVMLTTNTPALRLFPATPGPHPIVPAYGNGGSKETLFRHGRRSPPLVLIAIPWIRRDMENRCNVAPAPTSIASPRSLSGLLAERPVFPQGLASSQARNSAIWVGVSFFLGGI